MPCGQSGPKKVSKTSPWTSLKSLLFPPPKTTAAASSTPTGSLLSELFLDDINLPASPSYDANDSARQVSIESISDYLNEPERGVATHSTATFAATDEQTTGSPPILVGSRAVEVDLDCEVVDAALMATDIIRTRSVCAWVAYYMQHYVYNSAHTTFFLPSMYQLKVQKKDIIHSIANGILIFDTLTKMSDFVSLAMAVFGANG